MGMPAPTIAYTPPRTMPTPAPPRRPEKPCERVRACFGCGAALPTRGFACLYCRRPFHAISED